MEVKSRRSLTPAKSLSSQQLVRHNTNAPLNAGASAAASERAWDGLKLFIRQSGYQVAIISGTRTKGGCTETITNWLKLKAIAFNFQLGTTPCSPDEFLPTLQSSPDKLLTLAVIVSTYQGKPAPNTRLFINWLENSKSRVEKGETGSLSFSNLTFPFSLLT